MCRSATATNRVSYINEEKMGKVTPVLRKNQKKFVEIWLCDFVFYGFILNTSSLTGLFRKFSFLFRRCFFLRFLFVKLSVWVVSKGEAMQNGGRRTRLHSRHSSSHRWNEFHKGKQLTRFSQTPVSVKTPNEVILPRLFP